MPRELALNVNHHVEYIYIYVNIPVVVAAPRSDGEV